MGSRSASVSRVGVEPSEPFEVLRHLCHAFGSALDPSEASAATVLWARAASGHEADVSLAIADERGRLRTVVAGEGGGHPRQLSAQRREAFLSKAPVLLELHGGRGRALLPLVCRGDGVGILEVSAPRRVLLVRWEVLEAVASQAAILFRNIRDRSRLQREIDALRKGPGLADLLSRAGSAGPGEDPLELGIACVAHELRGPLLALRAGVEMLASTNGRGRAGARVLRHSQRELEHLAELVDDLLQWASGRVSIRRRLVDLGDVVRAALAEPRRGPGARRISFTGPGRLLVRVDPGRLGMAVANVVRNALAYSPPGSRVSVRVARARGAARISVRDRGPGLPPGRRRVIFDPFVRGPAGRLHSGGSGLGLFIARRIVEAHGGAIWADSNGTGATFHIELPAAKRDGTERGPLSAS